MKRNRVLCQSFMCDAKCFLSEYPQVKHEWSIDDDQKRCILEIPEACENGFSITVEADPSQITVSAGGAHIHYDLNDNQETDELAADVLGLVRDLLSPIMRIRERLAAGKPYKWVFEVFHDEEWIAEEWFGLFFWNYLGTRSEKVYQNKILPARDFPVE